MTKRPEEDRLLSRYIIVSKISFVKLFCRNLFPLIPPTHFTHLGAPNLSRLKKIRLCLVRHVHRFHQHRPVDWWGQDKSNMNTFQSNVWSSLSGLLERSSISFESNSAGQLVHDHSYFLPVLAQIWSELREKYFPDFGHFGWLDQMQILHWEKYKHSAKQILPRFWAPGEVVLELCWRFWRGCDRKKWKNVTHIQSGHTQEG